MTDYDDYKKLSIDELVKLLKNLDHHYHNLGETLIGDIKYDEIKDYLRKKDKNNPYFKHVGAEIINNKVKLPYFLGSQDKIKDDVKILDKWKKKYNNPSSYLISEKLDGISCLIVYNNDNIKIYTRGNGIYGQNITHLKDIIKGLPKLKTKIAVRGELIINKENWLKISHKGSNARNIVAGFVNAKTIDKEIAKYIEFVVYDVLDPRTKIEEALITANNYKFNVVKYIIVNELKVNELYDLYKTWKKESNYEIDGLVITHNDLYK